MYWGKKLLVEKRVRGLMYMSQRDRNQRSKERSLELVPGSSERHDSLPICQANAHVGACCLSVCK